MSDGQEESDLGRVNQDPGLARERTSLAWTRTALSFGAVGGVVLRKDVVAGLVIMAVVPAVWQLGRLAHQVQGRPGLIALPGRLRLVTATIVAVSLVALAVSLAR